MNRPSNQTIERYYFELFRSHYEVPDGVPVFTDKPDVIVRGTQTIGVEIANLYLASGADPASEQVQRARRLQVLDRAQAQYLASSGRNIELSVGFNPEYPVQELEPVALALAAIATKIEGSPSGQVSRMLFAHVPELRFLYYNQREYADAKWRLVQGYSVPALSIERLRGLVSDSFLIRPRSCVITSPAISTGYCLWWILWTPRRIKISNGQQERCSKNHHLSVSFYISHSLGKWCKFRNDC